MQAICCGIEAAIDCPRTAAKMSSQPLFVGNLRQKSPGSQLIEQRVSHFYHLCYHLSIDTGGTTAQLGNDAHHIKSACSDKLCQRVRQCQVSRQG